MPALAHSCSHSVAIRYVECHFFTSVNFNHFTLIYTLALTFIYKDPFKRSEQQLAVSAASCCCCCCKYSPDRIVQRAKMREKTSYVKVGASEREIECVAKGIPSLRYNDGKSSERAKYTQ